MDTVTALVGGPPVAAGARPAAGAGGEGDVMVQLPPPSGRPADLAPPSHPVPPAPYAAPAWEDVVRDHGARVFRLAYRLTGNRHDAEDLTQEVFVRVFRSLSQYTPGTFEGWLHRITTNLFLDGVRRKARIRFDALPEDAGDRLAGREPGPAQTYDDSTYDADVQAALDQLPAEFRAAVVLCDVEGLSYEEIAAVLGVKLGTVRSRIHRGRAQLRDALAHRAPRTGTATRLPAAAPDSAPPTAAMADSGELR
ncbi:MAG TPA: RNA polymerase sigma factor SigE [Candidatus Nanopelagicales bacterium]|jgi:RNA polymerase sigma-70 factor (ECF subfamily)|nr:RNA polymerase sigma factor SigE [Candidatus Nanopelagicales bacterium]